MDMTLTKEAQALLSGIRNSESSLDASAYSMRYSPAGGATFSDFSHHPGIKEVVPWRKDGKKSDAAGAYQFLSSTYKPIAEKYGLKDFSPESQDKAAWALAQENYKAATGNELQSDLEKGKWADAARVLSPTWTSLPAGDESNKKTEGFYKAVSDSLAGKGAAFASAGVNCAGQFFRSACEWSAENIFGKPVLDKGVEPESTVDRYFNRILAGVVGLGIFTIGLVKLKV